MRILLLIGPDPWIELYQRPFLDLGHEVSILRLGTLTNEQIEKEIRAFGPHFCLCQSLFPFDPGTTSQGEFLEDLLSRLNIRTAAWMVDGFSTGSLPFRERFLKAKLPQSVIYFSVDRGHLSLFENAGVKSFHLPVGISKELESIKIGPFKDKLEVAFVGAPPPNALQAPLASRAQILPTFQAFFLVELFEFLKSVIVKNQLQWTEIQLMEKLSILVPSITEFFQADANTANFFEQMKANLLQKAKEALGEPLFFYFQIYADLLDFSYSHYQITDRLSRLSETQNVQIFGGDRWRSYLGLTHDTPKLSLSELYSVFKNAPILICLTKWHFKTVTHERPLLTLACGGFPLTDHREELNEMLSSDEVASYSSYEEMRDKIQFYLNHPAERNKISAAGRARVFKDHTYHHRAQKILEVMQKEI
ncbi:MAG: glycosyltransferase family 1 protein [Deltaproteobacteria bacterium]|nr:glycosyltransferase family 1 protein [Deltaproteobacteria bacterium]